jgi:hypothetical protein
VLSAADGTVVFCRRLIELEAAIAGQLRRPLPEPRHLIGIHWLELTRDPQVLP